MTDAALWLARARRSHARLACALLALGAAAAALGGAVAMETQLALLALGVALLGLPHGALDHRVGRRLFARRFGSRWAGPFALFYLGAAALVLLGWIAAPGATLIGFLALSIVHFGLGDAETRAGGALAETAEILARGGAPVALAILFHPQEAGVLFGWLTGAVPAASAAVEAAQPPLAALWGLAAAGAAGALARRAPREAAARLALLELALLLLVFALCPPLLAFTLYFCLLHSPRHLLDMAAAEPSASPARAWARLMRAAAPLTLATLALAALGYALLRQADAPSVALLRTVFWGLSALTVPHMILTALETRPPPRAVRA